MDDRAGQSGDGRREKGWKKTKATLREKMLNEEKGQSCEREAPFLSSPLLLLSKQQLRPIVPESRIVSNQRNPNINFVGQHSDNIGSH